MTENRLESINRNKILPGINFQGEKLVLATKNSVGATVQLREMLYGGVLANKQESGEQGIELVAEPYSTDSADNLRPSRKHPWRGQTKQRHVKPASG